MEKFFKCIGIIVVSLILFSIPILTGISICLKWGTGYSIGLVILCIFELVVFNINIMDEFGVYD